MRGARSIHLAKNSRHHSNASRPRLCHHLGGVGHTHAPDSHHRHRRHRPAHGSQPLHANHRAVLGACGAHGAAPQVVGAVAHRGLRLRGRLDAHAQQAAGAQQRAHRGGGQVALAHVHAHAGAQRQRNVDAVVDDQRHARGRAHRRRLARSRQELAALAVLLPHLHKGGTALDGVPHRLAQGPAHLLVQARVRHRIQPHGGAHAARVHAPARARRTLPRVTLPVRDHPAVVEGPLRAAAQRQARAAAQRDVQVLARCVDGGKQRQPARQVRGNG
mmetsp:Transcript_24785/g.62916  ORF Transcript_24785/g.62916 Transcript_24785/m.62916 type:complete len:274 (+) Transcript_24785:393-1214(+)